MKKNLFFFLAAGMAFASCVSDETVGEQGVKEPAKLTFSHPLMQSNGSTRAYYYGEIGNHMYPGTSTVYHYPNEEDFKIYAVQHAGDFAGWGSATEHEMYGQSVSYDKEVDGWAPKTSDGGYYYWPSSDKMSFAASSPADLECGATRKYGATGLTITDFHVNEDASKHYDLLYSERTLNQTAENMRNDANYYSGISIDFKHALSSVRFSISNESEAVVLLKSIKVYGVKYKGTFKENLTEDPADYGKQTRDPKWDVIDELISVPYVGFEGSVQFRLNPQYVAELAATDTDEPGEVDNCNQLLLMPQTLTDEAKVVVTYTVNDQEKSKTAELNNGIDLEDHPVHEWLPGVRYTYRLVYGKSAADKDRIYFAPGAEAWKDHSTIVIDL